MYKNYFENMGLYLSKLQNITQTFQDWGYLPTLIPILEEHNIHKPVENYTDSTHFKVLDTNGNVLLLRSDTTLSLAHLITSHLDQDTLGKHPLRLYYSNDVVRPSFYDFDVLQMGIEFVGKTGIDADVEVMCLLDTALSTLELAPYKICIGSLDLCSIFAPANIKQQDINMFYKALSERNFQLVSHYVGKKKASFLLHMCRAEEVSTLLNKMLRFTTTEKEKRAIERYNTLIKKLCTKIDAKKLICDLSEVGSHRYYTGSVFSFYMEGCPTAIAQGGRYDKLLKNFGLNTGACGGTLFPHLFSETLLTGVRT